MDDCMKLDNEAIAHLIDENLQLAHRRDSLIILVYTVLMVLSAITIWTFKHRRFPYFHETGLSVIYGLIVGIALRYGIKPSTPSFETCTLDTKNRTCAGRLPPEKLLVKFPMGNGGTNLTLAYAFERAFEPSTTDSSVSNLATFNPEIFFNILLPSIIFAAGYSMKRRHFFRNIGAILLYAFLGTLVSSICVGVVCYLFTRVTSLSSKLFLSDCLFFGSIISATDPITVLAIFNDVNVDVNLYALVFGESVMNDAVAIALSQSVEQYGSRTSGNFDSGALFTSIWHFVAMFGTSFAIGVGVGVITALMTKFTHIRDYPLLETALFVLMSYSTFLLAETIGFTGIVAVLFCGITQAHYTYNNLSEQSKALTKQIFELINFLSENFLFAYLGVSTFTFEHHYWDVRFVLIALLACFLARAASVYPLSAVINLYRGFRPRCCPPRSRSPVGGDASAPEQCKSAAATATTGKYQVFENSSQSDSLDLAVGRPTGGSKSAMISLNMQHMLFFSGLRGAMAFSLAIRNTSSEIRQMFFSTTIVVVMVTVLLCGGLVTSMLKWLKIQVGDSATETNAGTSQRCDVVQDKSEPGCFNRRWSRFDKYYLKPLLTHSTPLLTETLPWCCFGLAKLLTSEEQRNSSAGNNDDLEGQHARYFSSGDSMSQPDKTPFEELYRTTAVEQPGATPLPSVFLSAGMQTGEL